MLTGLLSQVELFVGFQKGRVLLRCWTGFFRKGLSSLSAIILADMWTVSHWLIFSGICGLDTRLW